jgi:hypothetical protein
MSPHPKPARPPHHATPYYCGVILILLSCASTPKPTHSPSPEAVHSSSPEPLPGAERAEIECTKPGLFGPSIVSAHDYEHRHGADASRFSDFTTSLERPLEACGIDAALEQLARLTCNDGTNPFGGDPHQAHASRAGSMGSGGRCDAIIDLYEVPCPEGEHSVYVDMYFCGPG